MTDDVYKIPNDRAVSGNDIHPDSELTDADLSEAHLAGADLSGAKLAHADFSDADLHDVDFSGAYLMGADFSEATMGDVDLSGAELTSAEFTGAVLENADLSKAHLPGANLSKARLYNADLSEALLPESTLIGADLLDADLSEAKLEGVDLSEARLYGSSLSGAEMRGANLSDADLVNANLTNTLLWDTTLSGVLLSRGTNFDPPRQRLEQYTDNKDVDASLDTVQLHDAVARINHELRLAYSENGLINRARKARVRERKARRKEAWADNTLQGTLTYLGSRLSQITTGYGVQLLPIGVLMSALLLGSASIYWWAGMNVQQSLYYSIVTFTTSPPSPPKPGVMKLVAGIETFLGTTAIVFLGYVLGTREQV